MGTTFLIWQNNATIIVTSCFVLWFHLATGPVTVETNGTKFLQDIENLSAYGGGDGAELTFTGILDAMRSEPEPGSPMYVFTDASAKDATDYNITKATVYAKFERIPINPYKLLYNWSLFKFEL